MAGPMRGATTVIRAPGPGQRLDLPRGDGAAAHHHAGLVVEMEEERQRVHAGRPYADGSVPSNVRWESPGR